MTAFQGDFDCTNEPFLWHPMTLKVFHASGYLILDSQTLKRAVDVVRKVLNNLNANTFSKLIIVYRIIN